MINLSQLQSSLQKYFEEGGIDKSDLDWILVEVLKIKRSELTIDRELTKFEVKKIQNLAKKRFNGIPLSQVLGLSEFFGLNFKVNEHVLTPRPETELLVEMIMKENQTGKGLDLCTGSGAIAISLNKLAGLEMVASDISGQALKVAKENNKKLKTDIAFIKSDLFDKIDGEFDFIVSNPPYIKSAEIETLDTEVKDHEPRLALDGGESGLEFYQKIIETAPKFLKPNGKIYFELGINQSEDVKKLLEAEFKEIEIVCDYNKIERIIKATKK